jgi:hypothetical protein
MSSQFIWVHPSTKERKKLIASLTHARIMHDQQLAAQVSCYMVRCAFPTRGDKCCDGTSFI